MIKVNKNYQIRPLSLQSNRAAYQSAIGAVIVNGGWFPKATNLYRSGSVKRELNSIYNHKCAFCENKPVGSPAQVEHFRPKDGIYGIIHTGYYWLAYEWSNLLLACGNCNTTKRTHFPINNNLARVMVPTLNGTVINEFTNFILNDPLKQEDFILLNPEIDQPSKHLTFSPTGLITHLTSRGGISIIQYDLNRDELYTNGRKRIKDKILKKFLTRLERYIIGTRTSVEVIEDLKDVIREDIIYPIANNLSFSAFYRQMLMDYNSFYVSLIGNAKAARVLRFAFIKIINSL